MTVTSKTACIYDALRDSTARSSKTACIYNARKNNAAKIAVLFDALRDSKLSTTACVFDALRTSRASKTVILFSARKATAAKTAVQFHEIYPAGWYIVARNVATDVETELGFIAEGATTLTDVALADGTYEVEARASSLFWDDARSGKRVTIVVVAGVIGSQGYPIIDYLRRELIVFEP